MVEDEDINKGNQYRREEFNNKTEPEFNKNVARINEFRHINSEWSVAHKCRVSSSFYTNEQCFNKNQFCFSAQLNYNFIEQNYKFGNFSKQLEFLRHFPRCWLRLAPLICLGHFRPCEVSSKNVANQLYVLLEQFSMKSCTNMLDHCSFAMEHLLAHFPGYLNCDSFYEGNKPGNNSDNVIYKKDCKINYTKVHPELASLATDSYQCLWPLINPGRLSLINDGFTNSSLNNIQLEPVIDGCYLPCRSPLFDFGDLYNYNFVVAILHFCIVLVVLLAISFIVAKNSQNHFCHQKQQINKINYFLPNSLRFSIFSILFFIAINSLIMAISSFPEEKGERIIGELAICLNINGILIRSYSSNNGINEGGTGMICTFQAFLLNFSSLFINSSFLLFFIKLFLPSKILNLIYFILPKWNSILLPILIFLYSFICALFDLYYNKIFIDPVNGFCNHFLYNNLFTRYIFAYLIIGFCLFGCVYYINWIKYSQKKEKSKANIKNNYDFELKQKILLNKSEKPFKKFKKSQEIINEQEEALSQISQSKISQHISKINLSKMPYFASVLQNVYYFYLNKIFVLLIILIIFRIFAGRMLINQDEERELILRSINCSINRSLAEGSSLNWINLSHYKKVEGAETNPEIRKRLLGEKTSAPYCQINTQNLAWYWIFSLLIFICHLVIIIVLMAIEHNSELTLKENDFKMVEGDEDVKLNVELQQFDNNNSCSIENNRRRQLLDEQKIMPNNNTIEHQHIENEHHYDRISSTPASTFLNPNNINNFISSHQHQPPLISPPQLPQQQINQQNNNLFNQLNDLYSSDAATLTALYYHYYCSQYSLPPQFLLPQQLFNNENGCIHQENLRENQQQNQQQNSEQIPLNSRNSQVQNWMQNTSSSNIPHQKEAVDKRKRAGSDPGTTKQNSPLEKEKLLKHISDRSNNKNRRHRLLHIRGAPKELQKEWRKRRERENQNNNNNEEKNKNNYCSSVGESTLFEELEKLRKDRYGQILSQNNPQST
ncbi:hypothetical protein ACQ4LE_011035, partial [Meloidogyne hapla]